MNPLTDPDVRELSVRTMGHTGLLELRIQMHDTPVSHLFEQRGDESREAFITRGYRWAKQEAAMYRQREQEQQTAA